MSDRRLVRLRRVIALVAVVVIGLIILPGGVTQSTTVVNCARTGIDVGHSANCVATVFGFSPTGTVSFASGGTGQAVFSPEYCLLAAGTCDVTVNGTVPGMVVANASYLGDANNGPSVVGSSYSVSGGGTAAGGGHAPGSGTGLTFFTPLLSPTAFVVPGAVTIGQSARLGLDSSFAGGTPPYTCAWFRLPPNATSFSQLGTAFRCTQETNRPVSTGVLERPGTWIFVLRVTDSSDEGPPTTVDSNPVTVQAVLPGQGPRGMTVSCQPSNVRLRSQSPFQAPLATTCRVTVIGNLPTGAVRWTASAAGTFPLSACTLVDGTCMVVFYPHATGAPVEITAFYRGNSQNPAANATASFTVSSAFTRTSVVCVPNRPDAGSKVRCFAFVSGYLESGTVAWRASGTGNATFYSSKCTLADGACSVYLLVVRPGLVAVHAIYGGDGSNIGSVGTEDLSVAPGEP